jgi:dTDP-4-dehydrorhamnose reductase
LPAVGDVYPLDHAALDICDPEQSRNVIRRTRPQLIVNAAAYTDVERAESEPDTVYRVNAVAPAVIAEEARAVGAAMIHYSTDYVFDGDKRTPYLETDTPRPLNIYASAKLEGDKAVAAAGIPYLVLRVSWVYGAPDRGFVSGILRKALAGENFCVVDDQMGVPTWCRRIAEATAAILKRVASSGTIPDDLAKVSGVYHCAAQGAVSRAEFAERVLASAGLDAKRLVTRITTSAYPTAAVRPLYSVLDSSRLANVFGVVMPPWNEDLAKAMPSILGAVEKGKPRA